jgi:hypothetical protein
VRIHRIRLRDYKGVDDAEVEFATDGVTIVEGPNEVGKTSLAEALVLVLEQLDTSNRAEIREAKPVHNDAGPWVEVELTTGPYRLIIEKRWLRAPMTHLRVLEPKAEESTGREAHDRVRAILAETLDEQLFRALHHHQGAALEQAAVGSSTSLASALDAAASGSSVTGQHEATLVELVAAERLRYFTPTGRPLAERVATEREVAVLGSSVAEARAALDALDALAEEHRSLVTERNVLAEERSVRAKALEEEAALWESVQARMVAVAQATTVHRSAEAVEAEAQRRIGDRHALRDAEVTTAARRDLAAQQVASDRPAIEAARLAVQRAMASRDVAREARTAAEQSEHAARDREEYTRRLVSRALWSERLAHVRTGQTTLAEVGRIFAANRLDERRLATLESAALAVTEASARLDASSTVVRVEAIEAISLTTDGVVRRLASGEHLESRVEDVSTIKLGDLATITVTGGAPEADLREVLEKAEGEFRGLVTDAGLPPDATVAHCRLAAQQRRDALAEQAQAEQLIATSLRDLTIDRLEQEVEDDDAFLAAYAASHDVDVAPTSVEEARATLAESMRATATATEADDAIAVQLELARTHERELAETVSARATALQVAISLHDGAVEALTLARAAASDDELEANLHAARTAAQAAVAALSEADKALDALDPSSVEARLANAKDVVARVERDFSDLERRIVEVETTLALKGEEGLQDRFDELVSTLERTRREHERLERAANAVNLLWNRLVARRDEAQRSYVAPYRAEIERLGRIVYGPSFAVEIDHATLAVESRTLDGRTVAFAGLSTGAKEQLCVLARLACAGIAAATDGGAPVVIDDALGWSDPARLERIGAAFAAASHGCQVIVLTCDPARYRSVGNAVVRHLVPVTAA